MPNTLPVTTSSSLNSTRISSLLGEVSFVYPSYLTSSLFVSYGSEIQSPGFTLILTDGDKSTSDNTTLRISARLRDKEEQNADLGIVANYYLNQTTNLLRKNNIGYNNPKSEGLRSKNHEIFYWEMTTKEAAANQYGSQIRSYTISTSSIVWNLYLESKNPVIERDNIYSAKIIDSLLCRDNPYIFPANK